MKRKSIHIFLILLLCSANMIGQTTASCFNTISSNNHRCVLEEDIEENSSVETSSDTTSTSAGGKTPENDFSMLSIDQLESMIAKYESIIENKRKPSALRVSLSNPILSYYKGTGHDLTIDNIMNVFSEVGLSNKLFVLAQAVLETGNFSSHVCHDYHNLFGLYDSRHHDYYRFQKWEDSVVGYQKFIQYKYKGGNYLNFLNKIGYAEDKGYTAKIARIAKQLYHKFFSN